MNAICIISKIRGKHESDPEGAKRPTSRSATREFTSRAEREPVSPLFDKIVQFSNASSCLSWFAGMWLIVGIAILTALTGCGGSEVVAYISVDQPFAEPILASFAARTGIIVRPLFDTEAAKTVGIVSRLRAETARPQADVFWNSEFAHTFQLAREGLFESYSPPTASDIPTMYRDPKGFWTCIGARARVLLINTDLVASGTEPKRLIDLVSNRWQPGQVAVSSPLFGTGLTHAAAMYAESGEAAMLDFFVRLKRNGGLFLDGNALVRDRIVAGALPCGLIDSDDALVALTHHAPVKMILPDQGPNGSGTLLIPNSVSLIKRAPHPQEARMLVDFLVSAENEILLAQGESRQIPVRPHLQSKCGWLPPEGVKAYPTPLQNIAGALGSSSFALKNLFLK